MSANTDAEAANTRTQVTVPQVADATRMRTVAHIGQAAGRTHAQSPVLTAERAHTADHAAGSGTPLGHRFKTTDPATIDSAASAAKRTPNLLY